MQLSFEFQKQLADESNILPILLLKWELSWKMGCMIMNPRQKINLSFG